MLTLQGRRKDGRLEIEAGARHGAAVIDGERSASRTPAPTKRGSGPKRPNCIPPTPSGRARVSEDALLLDGEVAQVSYPGGQWRHLVDIEGRIVVVDAPTSFEPGTRVRVRVPGKALFVFPEDGAGRIAPPAKGHRQQSQRNRKGS